MYTYIHIAVSERTLFIVEFDNKMNEGRLHVAGSTSELDAGSQRITLRFVT